MPLAVAAAAAAAVNPRLSSLHRQRKAYSVGIGDTNETSNEMLQMLMGGSNGPMEGAPNGDGRVDGLLSNGGNAMSHGRGVTCQGGPNNASSLMTANNHVADGKFNASCTMDSRTDIGRGIGALSTTNDIVSTSDNIHDIPIIPTSSSANGLHRGINDVMLFDGTMTNHQGAANNKCPSSTFFGLSPASAVVDPHLPLRVNYNSTDLIPNGDTISGSDGILSTADDDNRISNDVGGNGIVMDTQRAWRQLLFLFGPGIGSILASNCGNSTFLSTLSNTNLINPPIPFTPSQALHASQALFSSQASSSSSSSSSFSSSSSSSTSAAVPATALSTGAVGVSKKAAAAAAAAAAAILLVLPPVKMSTPRRPRCKRLRTSSASREGHVVRQVRHGWITTRKGYRSGD
mmetsp:Transcript_4078/g.7240  ORF Transcript_4078/g.7240 Transcript_4078/m.7240 type:complete len:403 (-) Transcript_4078:727-1935(-)